MQSKVPNLIHQMTQKPKLIPQLTINHKATIHGLFLFLFVINAPFAFLSCSHKNWVVVNNNNCKIYDPEPVAGQLLKWNGSCRKGHAQGYGVLSVYEKGILSLKCEGNAIRGYLQGFIIFSTYKNGKPLCKYEETWIKGKPVKRNRNLTLDNFLSTANGARKYLYLLKTYQQNNPKAWMTDFHKILLQKTAFVCKDINLKKTIGGQSEKKGIGLNTHKTFKNELLFKVFNYLSDEYTYFTIFNHRIASLKELVNEQYRPGGEQCYTNDVSVLCSDNYLPTNLPVKNSPIQMPQENGSNAMAGEKIPDKRLYWYPIRMP